MIIHFVHRTAFCSLKQLKGTHNKLFKCSLKIRFHFSNYFFLYVYLRDGPSGIFQWPVNRLL